MKNLFLIAALAAILPACNNNADKHAGHEADHTMQQHSPSDTSKQAQGNAITASMDKMMQGMHSQQPTGNNDVDFAAMMVEHHKGAVDMSQVELASGKNAELKAFATKLVADQSKEISMMQDIISKASGKTPEGAAAFQKALNNSMMAMMTGDVTVYNDIDKDYAAQMIPHHQSAVDMAKVYLQFGKDKSLEKLSKDIITSQTKEIEWLKQWLSGNAK